MHNMKSVLQVTRCWPGSACCILCYFSWRLCCYTSQQYYLIGVNCINETLRTVLKFADQLLKAFCNTSNHCTSSLSSPLLRTSVELSPRLVRAPHCVFLPRPVLAAPHSGAGRAAALQCRAPPAGGSRVPCSRGALPWGRADLCRAQ